MASKRILHDVKIPTKETMNPISKDLTIEESLLLVESTEPEELAQMLLDGTNSNHELIEKLFSYELLVLQMDEKIAEAFNSIDGYKHQLPEDLMKCLVWYRQILTDAKRSTKMLNKEIGR